MGDGGGGGDPEGRAQNPESLLGKILRSMWRAGPTRRSTPWACATPGASPSTARRGACGSPTSARTSAKRSTTCRPRRRRARTSAGAATRAPRSTTPPPQGSSTATSSCGPWPSTGTTWASSITGGYVYRGAAIPALRGHYLYADFISGLVWAMRGPDGEPQLLEGADGQDREDLILRRGRPRRALRHVTRRAACTASSRREAAGERRVARWHSSHSLLGRATPPSRPQRGPETPSCTGL